jgi:hypothetical protein
MRCSLIDGRTFYIGLESLSYEQNSSGMGYSLAVMEMYTNPDCPRACYECNAGTGGETPGGAALVDGVCTQYCSGWGYCGDSSYNVGNGSQSPVDCSQCAD